MEKEQEKVPPVQGDDLRIYDLKNRIVNMINLSNLPVGVAFLIIKDLYQELENLYNTNIQQQNIEFQNALAEFNEIEKKDKKVFSFNDMDTSELSDAAKEKWQDFLNEIKPKEIKEDNREEDNSSPESVAK